MDSYKAYFICSALFCILSTVFAEASQLPIPYATSYESVDNSLSHGHLEESESSPGSYVHHYDKGSDGYKVESGFEGYIIPAKTHKLAHIKEVKQGILTHAHHFLEPLISVAIAVLPKVGLVLISVLALVVIGTLVSTCICAYTSMCHMTFMGLDLTKEQMRGFINQQSLADAARFVRAAVKKYQELNANQSEESNKVLENLVK